MHVIGLVTGCRRSDRALAVSLLIRCSCKHGAAPYAKDDVAKLLTPDGGGKACRGGKLLRTLTQSLCPDLLHVRETMGSRTDAQ